jgi:peptidoglycan/LPS O-acetylase OafA/YrhL
MSELKHTEVNKDRTVRFTLVDSLRGVAALWVVVYHAFAAGHLNCLQERLPEWISYGMFGAGNFGVAIFFVISGFVMAHSTCELRPSAINAARFMFRRSIRLDPPYWLSIIFVLTMAALSASIKQETFRAPTTSEFLAHLVYLQGLLRMEQINDVYWTLCYEIQFYLAFILLIYVSHRLLGRCSLEIFSVSLLAGLLWPAGIIVQPPVSGLFINLWYAFAIGVFAYHARTDASWRGCFLLGALILGWIAWERRDSFAATTAITACVVFIGADKSWLDFRVLQKLGLISYSLYLIHNPITGASFFLLRKLGFGTSSVLDVINLLLVLGVCLLASIAFYFCFERPSVKIARRVTVSRT